MAVPACTLRVRIFQATFARTAEKAAFPELTRGLSFENGNKHARNGCSVDVLLSVNGLATAIFFACKPSHVCKWSAFYEIQGTTAAPSNLHPNGTCETYRSCGRVSDLLQPLCMSFGHIWRFCNGWNAHKVSIYICHALRFHLSSPTKRVRTVRTRKNILYLIFCCWEWN